MTDTVTPCNLPTELAECILMHRIALDPPVYLPTDLATRVVPVLNALPPAVAPDVSSAILRKRPDMCMLVAARIGSIPLAKLLIKANRPLASQLKSGQQWRVVLLALKHGQVSFMDWWVSQGFKMGRNAIAYSEVPEFAEVAVRDWCIKHGFQFLQTENIVGQSWFSESRGVQKRRSSTLELSSKGRLNALELWRQDQQTIPASTHVHGTESMVAALCRNHLAIVHWWIKSGLCHDIDQSIAQELAEVELDSTCPAKALAFAKRVVDALPRHADGLHYVILMTCAEGQLDLFKYCLSLAPLSQDGTTTVHRQKAVSESGRLYSLAAEGGHVHVLNWLFANGFPLVPGYRTSEPVGIPTDGDIEFQNLPMDRASLKGDVTALDWFRNHVDMQSIDKYYSQFSIENAVRLGHVHVLQWWLNSQLLPKLWTCVDQLHSGLWCRSFQVFEWWVNTVRPSTADLGGLHSAVAKCRQPLVVELYRRHYDPLIVKHVLGPEPELSLTMLQHFQ